jgi:hypothetical protein
MSALPERRALPPNRISVQDQVLFGELSMVLSDEPAEELEEFLLSA